VDRKALGRSLQLLGLFIAPLGIVPELFGQVRLTGSLAIGVVGVLVFYVGYVMQHKE
jgi:hypothetical protein